ncbi:MAG: hypothetical protein L3J70_10705 [Gammaproteobacteria bacterium]|nr:hypothetical protein [Gammaproteobacteria bacterium]
MKRKLIIIPFVIVGMITAVWLLLPPSYKTDLSLIGQGKPVIVMVYDSYNAASYELVENFNQVHLDYEDRVEFVIADTKVPAGQSFERTYGASSASAVFFTGDGEKVRVLNKLYEPEVLSKLIDETFGF